MKEGASAPSSFPIGTITETLTRIETKELAHFIVKKRNCKEK